LRKSDAKKEGRVKPDQRGKGKFQAVKRGNSRHLRQGEVDQIWNVSRRQNGALGCDTKGSDNSKCREKRKGNARNSQRKLAEKLSEKKTTEKRETLHGMSGGRGRRLHCEEWEIFR